jgi:transcriptional regulator with XRE-family HTH domain
MLIERHWGSVNRAASALGLPQQTLSRIVTGETPNPRRQALETLARATGASLDWLLLGTGPEPSSLDSSGRPRLGSTIQWARLLGELGIEGSLREVLEDLPFTVFFAVLVVNPDADPHAPADYVRNAVEKCADAWIRLLEGVVAEWGAERVRAALQGDETLAALGFTPFGVWLDWMKGKKPRGAMAREYAEFLRQRPELEAETPLPGAAHRPAKSHRSRRKR